MRLRCAMVRVGKRELHKLDHYMLDYAGFRKINSRTFASRDRGVALAPVWGSVGNGRAYFNSMGGLPGR